jgi:hypothetical protein
MGKAVIIRSGCYMCSSNAFNNVAYVLSLGEPRAFQQEINMMDVKVPSSITVQKLFLPIIHTLI